MSRSVWVVLAVCVLGGVYQTSGMLADWISPPSRVAGNPEVVLYSNSWCGNCVKTRALLAEQGVPYTEYDIEKSIEGRTGYERLGQGAIPIVQIGERTVIRGYQPKEILAALGR